MNEIVNSLDSYKTRFSRFTMRLRPERNGYCAFIAGILFTRLGDIVEVQEFVEGVQLMVDKKLLTQAQEKALLTSAYDNPQLIEKIQALILEPMDRSEVVNVDDELAKLREAHSMTEKKEPVAPAVHDSAGRESMTIQLPNSQETEHLQENDPHRFMDSEEKKRQELELESLKLAQQLAAEEEAKKSDTEEDNCQICMTTLYDEKWLPLEKCGDVFHVECMKQAFRANILQRKFPLKCPNSQCNVQIVQADIKQIAGEQLYSKYQLCTFKSYVDTHGDSVSWCPTADCSHCFFYTPQDGTRFQCPVCKKDYCLKCRVEWHKNMTCKEFEINNTFSADDKKFIDFVKGAKFKQCPKCRFWVEKNMGCDHMSCRCGYQFCYKCGGKYGECECVKEAQQKMREQMARAEERRRKQLQAKERKRVKTEEKKRLVSPPADIYQPPRAGRGTRTRPKR